MTIADATSRLDRLAGYLRRDPDNIRLIVESVELASQLSRAEEALDWVDAALLRNSGEPRLLSVRGTTLLALGRPSEAAEVFESLIRQHGESAVLRFNLAHARLNSGRLNEGLELLDSVPEAERSGLPQFDLSYAKASYQVQRYDDALVAVDRWLKTHAGDAEGGGLKALLLLDTNRAEAAAALAQQLLKVPAARAYAHLVIGTLALFAHDGNAAEANFAKVVEAAPEAGRAWSGRGFAALLRQDLQTARQYLERAVRFMPDHPGTWQGLAWTCILLGNLGQAREAVDRSMALDRNFAENHGTLAVLQFMQGQRGEAELSTRKALKLNPLCASGRYARALLQDAAGQRDQANILIREILGGLQGGRGAALIKLLDSRGGGPPPRPPARELH